MNTRAMLKGKMNIGSQRMTRQRLTILDELRKVTSHPSAYGVYKMVQKKMNLPGMRAGMPGHWKRCSRDIFSWVSVSRVKSPKSHFY